MDAFEIAVAKFQKKALGLAYSFYPESIENREDLVGDTILKMLSNRDKYQEGTNLDAWGYSIMRNLFINEYRASSRHGDAMSLDDPEVYYQPSAARAGIDHDLIVKDVLKELPLRQKQLLWCYSRGYKYEEIADRFDLKLGTVKSLIFNARQRLDKLT
jgi:RNA polymerase sigma-70 factor (ECF subfamily)